MKLLSPILLLALLVSNPANHGVDSAKILGVFHFPGSSHFVMFESLFKGLAARGHDVTVLGHWPQKKKIPNYTDISVAGSMPTFLNNVTMEFVKDNLGLDGIFNFLWPLNMEMCRVVLEHPEVQKLIHSDVKYDVIISEIFGVDCFIGLAEMKQTPFIGMTSSVMFQWGNTRTGNPDHPAYIPSYFLPYTDHMSFTQRVLNVVSLLSINALGYYYRDIPMQSLARKHFGQDLPLLEDIAKNTSLILVNSHFSLNKPRPFVPSVVEVGGLHIPQPKKLPEDLEKFLNESPEGVVYFSMGSLVRTDSFSPDKLNGLIEAFSHLRTKVLWKINPDSLPPLPSNVKVMRWVPQTDLLNHPSIKAFITHGGLMGTQEAIYAGVPLIGIPLFGDQKLNIKNYVTEGLAVQLDYEDITTQSVLKAVNQVLDDPSYKRNAERMSVLFRDRPMSAMDTAIYWTEYVIKHGGAHHLRSRAVHMPTYQYLLLDVIGSLLAGVILFIMIIWFFIKLTLSVICKRQNNVSGKKQKKH